VFLYQSSSEKWGEESLIVGGVGDSNVTCESAC